MFKFLKTKLIIIIHTFLKGLYVHLITQKDGLHASWRLWPHSDQAQLDALGVTILSLPSLLGLVLSERIDLSLIRFLS